METKNKTKNKTRSISQNASYLDRVMWRDTEFLISSFARTTQDLNFDTIIGTGLSGALAVPPIARALGLKWAVVRKEDGSHSPYKIEGEIGERWLFVDDFVASGRTLERVKDAVDATVEKHNRDIKSGNNYGELFETTYVGTYEYFYNDLQDMRD